MKKSSSGPDLAGLLSGGSGSTDVKNGMDPMLMALLSEMNKDSNQNGENKEETKDDQDQLINALQ